MYAFNRTNGAPLNWSIGADDHHIVIADSLKTRQVEDAPEPDIELLESHHCSKVLVRLGDDDIDDELLRETHPEETELVHLRYVLPTMQVELAFGVGNVGHPPGAHSGLFELLIPRVHCGGFGVFRRWFVVVVALALANDKHIHQLTLMVVWPLHPNSLARVEESGLGGAEGTNAGGESMSDHCEFVASPIFRYGTYEFLPKGWQ